MLEHLFGSKLRVKILAALLTKPNDGYHIRQLARVVGRDAKNVSGELANLESIGLVRSERLDRLKHYRVDPRFFLHDELKSILTKTYGVEARLTRDISRVDGVEVAFIFGPFARGMESDANDIDLMVIGDVRGPQLDAVVRRIEQESDYTIAHHLLSRDQFRQKVRKADRTVMFSFADKKLFIKGSDADVRAIAK